VAKKTSKKATTKRSTKTEAPLNTQVERESTTFEQRHMGQPGTGPMDEKTFPSLVHLMDTGVQIEIDKETKVWNERLFTAPPYQGGEFDRFPLSPSQAGKCALMLGRNLSHYLGVSNYPRPKDAIQPRLQRIFKRGHLLEDALIGDFEKYTKLKVHRRQRRVRLPFTLGGGKRNIEGNIDVEYIDPETGTYILADKKSKGAFYSADFKDSINQTFQSYRQTGLVSEFAPNSFLISDALAFFNTIDLNDFFIDYLLQLNSYAFGIDVETGEQLRFDFCVLYYENKNSCENYELRWKPHEGLMKYVQQKFEFIYNNVRNVAASKPIEFDPALMTAIPREFSLGSSRCKLCDQKPLCYGEYDPSTKVPSFTMGALPPELDKQLSGALSQEHLTDRIRQNVLAEMDKQNVTHITLSSGITIERRWYKGNDQCYKLKQEKAPK
jgi:hypothetical protein